MEFNNWKGQSFAEYVNDLLTNCQDFLEFCETVKERYFADKDVEAEMLKKQNDLLHDIELDDLNYHGIARVGKEIRELRRNRRGYKNDYLMNEPVKELAKDKDKMDTVEKFIDIISSLKDDLEHMEEFIYSQKYNRRAKIENISEMKIEDSNEDSNRKNEDLIMLNRILNKYAANVETCFAESDDGLIIAKLQSEKHFSLKGGKSQLSQISEGIEKYYKPCGKPVICSLSTSDICLPDDYGKNILSGQISCMINDEEIYKIRVILRSGKKDSSSKSKKGSKKKGKKRK